MRIGGVFVQFAETYATPANNLPKNNTNLYNENTNSYTINKKKAVLLQRKNDVKQLKIQLNMALQWGVLAGVAGSIMSQVLSQINNKKQQQQADAESARRVAALEAKANENPLANSETRQFLGQYDRAAQRQIENARGVGNIKGASNEYMLGVQKAVAEGRADLMGNIEAKASERSDKYNDMAEVARHEKAVADQERTAARQQSYANLAANSMAAAGSLIDAYGGGAAKAPRNYGAAIDDANAAVARLNQQAVQAAPNVSAANMQPAMKAPQPAVESTKTKVETSQAPINKVYYAAEQAAKSTNNYYAAPTSVEQEQAKIRARLAAIH